MNPKENARRIIRFDCPERITTGLPSHSISYFGVNHDPFEGIGGHDSPVGTVWQDIWGVTWRKELDGHMGFAVGHPLSHLKPDKYPWPDPDDPRLVQSIYDKAKDADRENCFVVGSHRETLWERAYNLVGMDRLMWAFYQAPDEAREILRRIMDFQLGIARHYMAGGIEVAGTGDDLGAQTRLLLSRQLIQEFLLPEYRRLHSFYQQRDVIITRHCCGHVEPILDLFMDLGVDVLNPIQATANNQEKVRKVTRGRMALAGGVSTRIIMEGPPARIRAEARKCMWVMGRAGGYFCGPDQGLPFPEEHIRALHEAIEEYGLYPLSPP